MKYSHLVISLVITASLFNSCKFISYSPALGEAVDRGTFKADKNLKYREFEVSDFNAFRTSLPASIEYVKGPAGLSVRGPENMVDDLIVELTDDELKVSTKKNYINVKDLHFTLSSPTLESLSISGSCEFEAASGMSGNSFKLSGNGAIEFSANGFHYDGDVDMTVNGAADMDIEGISCADLSLTVNGAADCELKGSCAEAAIKVSGAADVDVYELNAESWKNEVRGAGKIRRKP